MVAPSEGERARGYRVLGLVQDYHLSKRPTKLGPDIPTPGRSWPPPRDPALLYVCVCVCVCVYTRTRVQEKERLEQNQPGQGESANEI